MCGYHRRATDVPTYVQYGAADLGIAGGRLYEHGGKAVSAARPEIARCKMMVAVRKDFDYADASAAAPA